MEKSKTGFDIMNLLAQSAAKINALEDRNVMKRKLGIKMPSSAECQDTASIVYHYLQGVSPTIASTLLDICPEVDTSCNFTLEEVVQAWKMKEGMEERALGVSKFKDKAMKKNPTESGSGSNNDISKTNTSKKSFKNSEGDIDSGVAQSVVKSDALEVRNVKMTTLETKMSSTTAMCLDTVSIVYNYLLGESPTIASLLVEIHPEVVNFPCNITLEEVVLLHWEANHTYIVHEEAMIKHKSEIENVVVSINITSTSRLNKRKRAFTPSEDEIIRNKMKEMGDALNIAELAVEIGRGHGAVWNRVNKLKTGEAGRKPRFFSLAEDEAIMEKVLPGLQENKLHELVLHKDKSLKELATALGRPNKAVSLYHRWVHNLQPWILQYYAGTTNLDIRMMLVNHLADTYHSRESIDWDAVAAKSEFAGNTSLYLQFTFNQVAIRYGKKPLITESSWEQIIGRCREYISETKKRNSKESELRRMKVIQYFENYVMKQEIDNFL